MKKTIFEEMGGTYIRHGDYLIPCLALPEEEEQRFIGVWGQRHKRYLKEHKKGYYTFLMINGSVPFELRNIDSAANERVKLNILNILISPLYLQGTYIILRVYGKY